MYIQHGTAKVIMITYLITDLPGAEARRRGGLLFTEYQQSHLWRSKWSKPEKKNMPRGCVLW